MKRAIAILFALVIVFAITVPFCFAETVSLPAPVVNVDITQLIIAAMTVVFNFLLVWILKAVIPPAKHWLNTHTSIEQQESIWNLVKRLVEAAEKTITGVARGSDRLAWVIAELKARGVEIDTAMIEAAVKEMEDAAAVQVIEAIEAIGSDDDEDKDKDSEMSSAMDDDLK